MLLQTTRSTLVLQSGLKNKNMYLYKTTLFKTGTVVLGLPVSNDADRVDFETNFKATALKVDRLELNETTFIVEKSYTDFKALIVSPILWSDVKYIESDKYELNLLSANPL